MGRKPCCSKEAGLNKGAWTPVEDKILTEYIGVHGDGKWRGLPERAGLKRCGKSCRLRWMNYLRPGIKRGSISPEEEDLILRLHKLLGNRWTLIAGRLPGRTDNEIKNHWNTKLAKKVDKAHSGSKVTKKRKFSAPQPGRRGDIKTSAVRTKATRSAKPIILVSSPSESEGEKLHEQLDQSCSSTSTTTSAPGIEPSPSSSMNFEENDQLADFVMDFEMDQHFLSDFLNTDWSALSNSENYGGDQSSPAGNIYNSEHIISSPAKSDEFLSVKTPDFESLVSLIDIDQLDNWLQF